MHGNVSKSDKNASHPRKINKKVNNYTIKTDKPLKVYIYFTFLCHRLKANNSIFK